MAESITSEGAVPTPVDRSNVDNLRAWLSLAISGKLGGLFVTVNTQVNRNVFEDSLEVLVSCIRDDGQTFNAIEVISIKTIEYYYNRPDIADAVASSLANRITKEAAKTPRRNLVEKVKARSISSPAKISLVELDAMRRENDAVIARVNEQWTREYYTTPDFSKLTKLDRIAALQEEMATPKVFVETDPVKAEAKKREAESQKQARLKRELEDNDIVRNESEERYALLELDLKNDKDGNKP